MKKRVTIYIEEKILEKLDRRIDNKEESRTSFISSLLRKNLLSLKDREATLEDYIKLTSARLKSIDSQQVILIEMIYRLQRFMFEKLGEEEFQKLFLEYVSELSNSLISDNTFLSSLENITSLKIQKETQ